MSAARPLFYRKRKSIGGLHRHHCWLTNKTPINTAIRIPTTSETTQCRLGLTTFDPAPFCAAPIPNQNRSLSMRLAPSSALLCGGLTMLTTTVNLPARRAPSPQIRARDTSLDGTTNGSAGINVDAGINDATHLGGQRCGDHEDRGDSTDYRKLAEHKVVSQQGRSWQRRTNVWQRLTSPVGGKATKKQNCQWTAP
jgi:hypothetical protein